MKILYKLFFTSVLFLLCHNLNATETDNALNKFLTDLETYSADFAQSLIDVTGEVIDTSTGKVYLGFPGKFHWRYKKPYSQYLITDSKTLWIYDEDLAQVTIKNVADELDNTPATILSGKDNIQNHFELIDKGIENENAIVELIPKDEENQFHNIQLSFHQDTLVSMVMFDKLGQITRIDFRNEQRNSIVDKNLFQFTPPPNVDVIDGRETLQQ